MRFRKRPDTISLANCLITIYDSQIPLIFQALKPLPFRFIYNKMILNFSDIIFAILIIPSAIILKIYSRVGGKRLPVCRETLKKIGVYPIRDHYYQPLFNDSHLLAPLSSDRNLPGLDLNVEYQLDLLSKINYSSEINFHEKNNNSKNKLNFFLGNGSFESGDAEFLYSIVRHFKPRMIVEIGSGHSTKIANQALAKNKSLNNILYKHICVEPYEMPWLSEMNVEVIRSRVELCYPKLFTGLQRNDLLFIDSSHIIRPQGDVLFEYLEILPTLNSGVIVHVHDIFTPKDYPDQWVRENVLFWNEQYLLEALLSNSSRYKVIAALNFLKSNYYSQLVNVCPYLDPNRDPGSFYFQIQ